tara:strand:- start:1238 stop:1474 length:237 start_codon:yes stop_codon:yes gene_type:complete
MKMHKEKYEELLLRFAKELHDVGVTENMKKIVESQYTRTPNLSNPGTEEATDRFSYRHDGYMIEAVRTVKLTIKTCTK